MKTLRWSSLSPVEQRAALARPPARRAPELQRAVTDMLAEVQSGGWHALCRVAERIDGAAPKQVRVAPLAAAARRNLPPEAVAAMELAVRNIRAFHEAGRPADTRVETMPGLVVEKCWRPIDRAGLYVPGGATPLFSTLLMLAVPAQAAGVNELVVVTPPTPDGLAPTIALAAELCCIDMVWTVGGAQAIAALAFGAGDIPPCPLICGPGNAWVAEAKLQATAIPGGPAIDMPAGPSELMVIADETADPKRVAADLLSQAEHDASAQVLLVTTDELLAAEVRQELTRQSATLPRRSLAEQALEHGHMLLATELDEAADIANLYAPEHLCLAVDDPEALIPRIRNAGAIFAGHAAAETFGDYLAGSSHVLPTDGAARAWSGITTTTFMKAVSVQRVSPGAAKALAAPAAALARLESLEAHARAAEARAA